MRRESFFMIFVLSLFLVFASCGPTDPSKPPSPAKLYTAGMISNAMEKATLAVGSPCAHPELIKPYMDAKVAVWFKLPENKENQKGILGTMCSTVVSAIVPYAFGSLATATIPKEFGCTGQNAGNAVAKIGSIACSFIPL